MKNGSIKHYAICIVLCGLTLPLTGCLTAIVALECATDRSELSPKDTLKYSVMYKLKGPNETQTKQVPYSCEVEALKCGGGTKYPDWKKNTQVVSNFSLDEELVLQVDTPSCMTSYSKTHGGGPYGYDIARVKNISTNEEMFKGSYNAFNRSQYSQFEFIFEITKQ